MASGLWWTALPASGNVVVNDINATLPAFVSKYPGDLASLKFLPIPE